MAGVAIGLALLAIGLLRLTWVAARAQRVRHGRWAHLAAEISRQTGRDIPYRDLPQAEYDAILKQVGVPEGFAEGVAAWDVDASKGALFDDGHQLSKLIGRPTTPLADAVRAQLAAQG